MKDWKATMALPVLHNDTASSPPPHHQGHIQPVRLKSPQCEIRRGCKGERWGEMLLMTSVGELRRLRKPHFKGANERQSDVKHRQAWCVRTESRLRASVGEEYKGSRFKLQPSNAVRETSERFSPDTLYYSTTHLLKPVDLCFWCIIKKTAGEFWALQHPRLYFDY